MKVDEDSILCPRIYCPSYCRPYMGYAVSSNSIFEFARLEKNYSCTFCCFSRPEISVFKTEWHYFDDLDPSDNFIGKLTNPCCAGEQLVEVQESIQGLLKTKY